VSGKKGIIREEEEERGMKEGRVKTFLFDLSFVGHRFNALLLFGSLLMQFDNNRGLRSKARKRSRGIMF
jgi:hypothetical protein